jgi:hypothetical protein
MSWLLRRRDARPNTVVVFDPRVFGESDYDRVTSMLLAIVVGAMMVVGLLALIYYTNQDFATRVSAPLQIIDVFGGGGGSPDGAPGSTEKIDIPGADAGALASNNTEEAGDFEEPAVMATPAVMLDAVSEAGEGVADLDIGPAMPRGGPVAGGKRASKIGTGGPGLGFGPGDGGIPAEQRWSVVYNPGQTLEEYGRQLDALGVELGVVSGANQLALVSRFSDPQPTIRHTTGQGDQRLFFLPQGRGSKASDIALLKKAGIEVGDSVVIQFYPNGVERQLGALEVRYKGRQPAEIRFTRFQVVPSGEGYAFAVVAQEPLR